MNTNPRLILIDLGILWWDAQCLTKLLLTGDRLLKVTLQQKITSLFQHYRGDPVLDIWQWPSLALTSFPLLTHVILVTDSVLGVCDHQSCSRHKCPSSIPQHHPLYQVDLTQLLPSIKHLTLKFAGVDKLDWSKVHLPDLDTLELNSDANLALIPLTYRSKISSHMIKMDYQADVKTEEANKITQLEVHSTHYKFHLRTPVSVSFILPKAIAPDQLTHLTIEAIPVMVDLYQLPKLLTHLSLINCRVSGAGVLQSIALTSLTLSDNSWWNTGKDSSYTIIDEDITTTCPPTLLTLVTTVRYDVIAGNIHLIVPASLTSLKYSQGLQPRVIPSKDDADRAPRGLTCLRAQIAGHSSELMDVLDLITHSPELRSLELSTTSMPAVTLITDIISQHCPSFTSLSLPYMNDSTAIISYLPHPNIVKCHAPYLRYLLTIGITAMNSNLQELSLVIAASRLQEFNRVLKDLRQLKKLHLSMDIDFINEQPLQLDCRIVLAAPASLQVLGIDVARSGSNKLIFKFGQKTGIPPYLKIIKLSSSYSAHWHYDTEQVQHFPLSLEWCYPLPPSMALHRLHNLIPI